MDILIGVIVGIVISQTVQHWDSVGPVLKAVAAEIKAFFAKPKA